MADMDKSFSLAEQIAQLQMKYKLGLPVTHNISHAKRQQNVIELFQDAHVIRVKNFYGNKIKHNYFQLSGDKFHPIQGRLGLEGFSITLATPHNLPFIHAVEHLLFDCDFGDKQAKYLEHKWWQQQDFNVDYQREMPS